MIYTLISITVILTCVNGSCLKEKEKGTGGISMSCSVRWSGEGADIRRLTIRSWDGSCRFPAGARLTLYGANQDCSTCSLSKPEHVIVNGERCTTAVSYTLFSPFIVKLKCNMSKRMALIFDVYAILFEKI